MQLWVTVFSGGSHLHRMYQQSCLKGFFVVKWIDCFRAVCLCECVWASLRACKQDLPLPSNHGRQSTPVCVMATHTFFPRVIGYGGLSWQLVRRCSQWCFPSFFSIKEEVGRKLTPPAKLNQMNITGTSCKWGKSRVLFIHRRVSHTNTMNKTCTESLNYFLLICWLLLYCNFLATKYINVLNNNKLPHHILIQFHFYLDISLAYEYSPKQTFFL